MVGEVTEENDKVIIDGVRENNGNITGPKQPGRGVGEW